MPVERGDSPFVGKLKSAADLEKLRLKILSKHNPSKPCITVCMGTGCHAYENEKVFAALEKEIELRGLSGKVDLRGTGCHGFCEQVPLSLFFLRKFSIAG